MNLIHQMLYHLFNPQILALRLLSDMLSYAADSFEEVIDLALPVEVQETELLDEYV